jgi:hypothetical protein
VAHHGLVVPLAFAWARTPLDPTSGRIPAAARRQATLTPEEGNAVLVDHDPGWTAGSTTPTKHSRPTVTITRSNAAWMRPNRCRGSAVALTGRVRPYHTTALAASRISAILIGSFLSLYIARRYDPRIHHFRRPDPLPDGQEPEDKASSQRSGCGMSDCGANTGRPFHSEGGHMFVIVGSSGWLPSAAAGEPTLEVCQRKGRRHED